MRRLKQSLPVGAGLHSIRHRATSLVRNATTWGRLATLYLPARKRTWERRKVPVIVSLTSFPPRIEKVWIAIESILRQRVSADRVVLVLSLSEFPDRKLPKRVEQQQSKGLEVIWMEDNIRSYKKLLPARAAYPEAIIVTVDDDTIYPKSLLKDLLNEHEITPDAIIGNRGSEVLIHKDGLYPYIQWPDATRMTASHRVLLTGVGGVLYPPGSMPSELLDSQLALRICPTNDDLWFWAMALLKRTPVRKVTDGGVQFPIVRGTQAVSLFAGNVHDGLNDDQLRRVLDHFELWERLRMAQ